MFAFVGTKYMSSCAIRLSGRATIAVSKNNFFIRNEVFKWFTLQNYFYFLCKSKEKP